jgi:hypothetical protein
MDYLQIFTELAYQRLSQQEEVPYTVTPIDDAQMTIFYETSNTVEKPLRFLVGFFKIETVPVVAPTLVLVAFNADTQELFRLNREDRWTLRNKIVIVKMEVSGQHLEIELEICDVPAANGFPDSYYTSRHKWNFETNVFLNYGKGGYLFGQEGYWPDTEGPKKLPI